MKGWYRDNYRHSLAARGFALRGRPKNLRVINRVFKPMPSSRVQSIAPLSRGVPDDTYNFLMSDTGSIPAAPDKVQGFKIGKDIEMEYDKLSEFPFPFNRAIVNKKRGRPTKGTVAVAVDIPITDEQIDVAIANIDNLSMADLESMSAGELEAMIKRGRNMDPVNRGMLVDALRQKTQNLLKKMKKAHKEETDKYVPINSEPRETIIPKVKNGNETVVEQSVVYTDDNLENMYKQRGSMAIREYLHDNLGGSGNPDKLQDFWSGTSHTLFRPMDDLDRDWESFSNVAGTEVKNRDTVDKWTNRGAALVGRVVTLANVEPLIDHSEGRNFRNTMVDLMFGRRLD